MLNFNLDEAANVLWIPAGDVPPAGTVWGGKTQHFNTLREAVKFTMVDLPEKDRHSAWVTTDHGNLSLKEIETIYRSLNP